MICPSCKIVPLNDQSGYSVDLWGSRPFTDDDCWTGETFRDREAALKAFDDPETWMGNRWKFYSGEELWISIRGPDIDEHRQICQGNPNHSDDEWRREFAMQQGMGLGVDAYNDAMGYDSEPTILR